MTETSTKIPDNLHFKYFPQFLAADTFNDVYKEVAELCHPYTMKIYDKIVTSPRLSCKLGDSSRDYPWNTAPTICQIRAKLEQELCVTFDYCFVHLYRDGRDYIGYHRDREALNSIIASVSLGTTRKFRFRQLDVTKGWDYEFKLASGDVVVMYKTCQRKYKHTVPKELRVKEPRINLTFRQYSTF